MIILRVGNVDTTIEGDLDFSLRDTLIKSMRYKTTDYNGFEFVEIEHNLFDKTKQSFPTGLCSIATRIFTRLKIQYEIIDNRRSIKLQDPLKLHEVVPHDYQEEIITKAIETQRFIIQVATGGGKTVIASAIIARLNLPTLFIVHTGDLFEQAYDELNRMLKVPIGKIGGGVCDIQKINVCMIQTLHAVLKKKYVPFDEIEKESLKSDLIAQKSNIYNDKIKKVLNDTQCVIIDECHHLVANSYVEMMKACKNALYKGGLCLQKSTKILLANGKESGISYLYHFTKNVDKIIDVVVFNLEKQIFENKKAKIIQIPAKNKNLYNITVRNYLNEIIEIKCSSEHKFYNNKLKQFIAAKDLCINDELFTYEKIKNHCIICHKEIKPHKKFCSNDCRYIGSEKNLHAGYKKWWNNVTDEELERFKELGRKRYKFYNDRRKNMTEEEKKVIRKKMSAGQLRFKENNSEVYFKNREKGIKNFTDPVRISNHLKKIWASYTPEQKKARLKNRIIAGLKSQEELKKAGLMKFKGCVTLANDNHICDSKKEAEVDNWLFKNNIKHEIHPFIENTFKKADFLVECNNQKIYIEYDGLNRGDTYHKIKFYEDLKLNYVIIKGRKLTESYLMEKLSFLLYNDPPAYIVKIEKIKNKEDFLYDLQILDDNENCHNFFANSILVHNSATPHTGDDREIILQAYAGKIIGKITESYLIKKGFLVKPTIYYLSGSPTGKYKYSRKKYQTIYKDHIVNNKYRNKKIVECVERLNELGKSVLITVTTKKHGKLLLDMIKLINPSVKFIYSHVDKQERKKIIQQVRERKLDVIIGTQLADEGLNIPALDAIILAGAGKSPTRIKQRIGRTLRLSPTTEKKEAVVIDFYDPYRYLTSHYKKRREICEMEEEFKIVEDF